MKHNKEKRLELLKLRRLKFTKTNESIDGETSNDSLEFFNIFISPDRTKAEQEQHKKLVLELKERINNGEPGLYIRNGKILKYQPFRGDAQLFWAE